MDLETLLAEREIQHQLFAIARAMDDRDWGALDSVMLEDASADLGLGLIKGRAEIIAFIRTFLDECGPTQHMLGNIVITIDGDRAESFAYVDDRHAGAGDKKGKSFASVGDYRDQWQRIDGRWWLVHRLKRNHAHIGEIEVLGPGPTNN